MSDPMEALTRPDVLWASWARVASGTRMPGADGITPSAFARQLPTELDRLAEDLRSGHYLPNPLRQLTVKKQGKVRHFALPTVRDRVAQRAVLHVHSKVLDAQFADVSFAYRRGASWLDALNRIVSYREAGLRSIARADIASFFDNIDHCLLREVLERHVPSEMSTLIMGWVSAPTVTCGGLPIRRKGIPQGACISPALANLFLCSFDSKVHGTVGQLVRYADDIAVACPDDSAALAAQSLIESELRSLRLRTNARKTYVSSFDRGFDFLGWVFYRDSGWADKAHPHWTHPLAPACWTPGGIR